MSDTPARVLAEFRAALEHQVEMYGSLVFRDRSSTPGEPNESDDEESAMERADATIASAKNAPESVPEAASDTVQDAAPDVSDLSSSADTNLFGEASDAPAEVEPDSQYARIEALIPAESPLHKLSTLKDVERWVAQSILTPLDETRTNPVFGVGNPNADLLVIGEAPGAEEDRQGEPFVGRAGQLLTKILQAIGFERSDVYIANILKSRPPNNRDPMPEEVQAHIPILYKQIALIQPKLILCVGKTSGTSLLNKRTSLAKMRGTFHDYHGLEVLVTYHPAALLRNPHWKRPTWEDVQLLRSRYDELGGV